MNRRGFFSALSVLATTAVLPSVPSIPIGFTRIPIKLAMNSLYGKIGTRYTGGRYEWVKPGSLVTTDIVSAYPSGLLP